MAYTIWMLEAANLTVSGGGSLSGLTQGDGSHLVGRTITLLNRQVIETFINDNDPNFDDNDSSQTLNGPQTIGGVGYPNGRQVEAEYRIVLRDESTIPPTTYQAVGYNVNNSSPAYATIEGLAFIGTVPPSGRPLVVVQAFEGPGSSGQPPLPAVDVAICFAAGTRIATPRGPVAVEDLTPGMDVMTRDHGPQAVRWAGRTRVGTARMASRPEIRPIRIRRGAFGPGRPARDTLVSPQHRILMTGWRAELLFGEAEVLVSAKHLVDDLRVAVAADVAAVDYVHILFDAHEVIFANGIEAESFLPGPHCLPGMEAALRAELLALFPALAADPGGYGPAARKLLRGWEGAMLAT